MFFCSDITSYLSIPYKKRTPELRSEAYIASYDKLIKWWESCLARNYETPILSHTQEKRAIDIVAVIRNLKEKRDEFRIIF